MQPLFVALSMVVFVVSTAAGAIYTYRDAQGRLHLTNKLERVPVAYREAALANQRSETPAPAVQTASAPVATMAPLSSPAPADPATATPPLVSPAPAAAAPENRPADTHELSMIRLGMSPEEVRQRLGAPSSVIKRKSEEHWLYPGNNQVPATVIRFKSGKVAFHNREGAAVDPARDFTFRKQN